MIGDSAGLLFKIKGDESDAVRALNHTQREADALTGSTTGLTSSFVSLAAPAAVAGAAIAAVGVAALAGARALFDLTQQAAVYGSEIYNASVKTGLSTETISALKLASDRTGVSMESLGTIVSRFSRLVGEAEQGSDKAAETLKRLGITPKEAIDNLDGALGKVFARIQALPDPISKATLAQQAFGKAGTELLKVIDDFNGDLPGAIAKARELGLVMSKEDAEAADEFGDTMDTLRRQIQGVGFTIGKEFLPEFQRMADSFSDFLAENKDQVKAWAHNLRQLLRGVVESFSEAKSAYGDYIDSLFRITARLDPLTRAILGTIYGLRQKGEAAINRDPLRGKAQGQIGDASALSDFDSGDDTRKEAERERDAARKRAELLAVRDLAAAIRIEAINLKTVEDGLRAAYSALRKTLSDGGAVEGFAQATNETTKQWANNLNRSLIYLEELEKRALSKDATDNERALLEQTQLKRRHDLKLEQDAEIKKNEDELWEERLRRGEALAEMSQRQFELDQQRIEQMQAALDSLGGFSGADYAVTARKPGLDLSEGGGGIFDQWSASWDDFFNRIEEQAPTLAGTFAAMAEMMQDAFIGIANAIGGVIQQWVLYGNTGPAVMRKVLAAALASIAAEAAVQAIYALALGFIRLAQHDYEGAGWAFASAAMWGAVAGAAAITGRLIAGNSFKQQANAATGGSTSSSTAQGRGPEGQGEAYSSQKDVVSEQSRNAPLGLRVTVADDSTWLGKMLRFEIANNSSVRADIRGLAEG